MKETFPRKEFAVWMTIAVAISSVLGFSGGYIAGMVVGGDETGVLVVDDYGRTVKVDAVPDRIVSIAPTPTELLFAVGAGDLVVGVDTYSDYPAEVAELPKVGDMPILVEAIVALEPDLIVCGDFLPLEQLELLQDQGIPYVVLATRTLDEVVKDVRLVGILTGHVDEANTLADSLEDRIETVRAKALADEVVKPRVYLEYYPYFTFGPGSFGNDLIRSAGGINVAENTSSEYPMISTEYLLAEDPEMIVYTVGYMCSTTAEDFALRPGWENMTAVVEDNIYSMDDNLVSRYGPRVVDGLEELAAILHPELFD
ncbi:MAG: ABC transporter substrate-binding protein [Methanobacteriota archaeon]|nr:MAG: ABC transporter substrate-binding protein [Euryarchaeota archaeon]